MRGNQEKIGDQARPAAKLKIEPEDDYYITGSAFSHSDQPSAAQRFVPYECAQARPNLISPERDVIEGVILLDESCQGIDMGSACRFEFYRRKCISGRFHQLQSRRHIGSRFLESQVELGESRAWPITNSRFLLHMTPPSAKKRSNATSKPGLFQQ
jgi:hypothetical protein